MNPGPLTQTESAVVDAVDMDGLLDFLAELIAIESVANAETPAQRLVASWMETIGLETDVWDIDFDDLKEHPAYTSDVERHAGLGVVGTLRSQSAAPVASAASSGSAGSVGSVDEASGQSGRTLILNGHVDVVPAGEVARWTRPPFELTREGDRLYGRGVVDMKGQVCAALFAAKAIRDAGVELAGALQVQSVIGEEDGGAGTLATILRGYTGDGAIVIEPTGFVVAPAQAGALSFRVTVPGKAAHGALREEGIDPIEKFIPIFHAIRALEARRNTGIADPLFASEALPFAITMGRIEAGIWPSTVAESLTVEGRYGVAPGEDLDVARRALEDAVAGAAAGDPWLVDNPPIVEWWGAQFEAARTDSEDPVVVTVAEAAGDMRRTGSAVGGVRFGADMRLLTNVAGIPTVLFGPGDVREAHRPDESVRASELRTATEILAVTALRFCGVDSGPR